MTIKISLSLLSKEQQQAFFSQVNRLAGERSVAALKVYEAGTAEATIQAYLAPGSRLRVKDAVVQEALLSQFGLTLNGGESLEVTVPDDISERMEADETCIEMVNSLVVVAREKQRGDNEIALAAAIKKSFEGHYIVDDTLCKSSLSGAVTFSERSQGEFEAKFNLALNTYDSEGAIAVVVDVPDLYSKTAVDDLRLYPDKIEYQGQTYVRASDRLALDFEAYKNAITTAADQYIAFNKKWRDSYHNKQGLERVQQLKRDIDAIDTLGEEGIQALTRALGACFHLSEGTPGVRNDSFISFLLEEMKRYDLTPLKIPALPLLLEPRGSYRHSFDNEKTTRELFRKLITKPGDYIFAPRVSATQVLTAETLSSVIKVAAAAYTAVHKGEFGKERANQLMQAAAEIMQSDLDEAGKLSALVAAIKVCLHPETGKKPGTRNDSLVAFLLEGNGQEPGLKAYVLPSSLGITQVFYPENDYTYDCKADLKAFLKQLPKPTPEERAQIQGYVKAAQTRQASQQDVDIVKTPQKGSSQRTVPVDEDSGPSSPLPRSYSFNGNASNPMVAAQSSQRRSFDGGSTVITGRVVYDSSKSSPFDSVLDEAGKAARAKLVGAPVSAKGGASSMGAEQSQPRGSFDGSTVTNGVRKERSDSYS